MSTRPAESVCSETRGTLFEKLRWRAYDTPWGEGRIAVDSHGLRAVDLPRLKPDSGECAPVAPPVAPPTATVATPQTDPQSGEAIPPEQEMALTTWCRALEEYFRGERLSWSADEIPWDSLGIRPFHRQVYEALLTVPPGHTVSYGHLADMAGFPRAARAVGTAMANNPIPIVIPCHRVIRADGSLGNYGDEPDWKPLLLDHERAAEERLEPS